MADANAAKKDEEAPSAEKKVAGPQAQKPLFLMIVILLNMLVMCSVVMILWTSYKAEKGKPKLQDVIQGEKDTQAVADQADDDTVGKMVPLETFLVNLAGTHGSKLAKINMDLEVDSPKVEEEIEKRKPQIRDIIIILLSSKTYDQVTTHEGKESLRDEVRETVNSFLTKGKIKKVYFTDFIVN